MLLLLLLIRPKFYDFKFNNVELLKFFPRFSSLKIEIFQKRYISTRNNSNRLSLILTMLSKYAAKYRVFHKWLKSTENCTCITWAISWIQLCIPREYWYIRLSFKHFLLFTMPISNLYYGIANRKTVCNPKSITTIEVHEILQRCFQKIGRVNCCGFVYVRMSVFHPQKFSLFCDLQK